MSENLRNYISEISKLEINEKTKTAIAAVMPSINTYIEEVTLVTMSALEGRREEAVSRITSMQKSFSELEENLEKLGELIEADAHVVKSAGESTARKIVYISVIGFLMGLFCSIAVIISLSKSLIQVYSRVEKTSDELHSSAQSMSSLSQQLETSTEQQSSSLHEVSASIDSISSMAEKSYTASEQSVYWVSKSLKR